MHKKSRIKGVSFSGAPEVVRGSVSGKGKRHVESGKGGHRRQEYGEGVRKPKRPGKWKWRNLERLLHSGRAYEGSDSSASCEIDIAVGQIKESAKTADAKSSLHLLREDFDKEMDVFLQKIIGLEKGSIQIEVDRTLLKALRKLCDEEKVSVKYIVSRACMHCLSKMNEGKGDALYENIEVFLEKVAEDTDFPKGHRFLLQGIQRVALEDKDDFINVRGLVNLARVFRVLEKKEKDKLDWAFRKFIKLLQKDTEFLRKRFSEEDVMGLDKRRLFQSIAKLLENYDRAKKECYISSREGAELLMGRESVWKKQKKSRQLGAARASADDSQLGIFVSRNNTCTNVGGAVSLVGISTWGAYLVKDIVEAINRNDDNVSYIVIADLVKFFMGAYVISLIYYFIFFYPQWRRFEAAKKGR